MTLASNINGESLVAAADRAVRGQVVSTSRGSRQVIPR
jgi:hypothetical protein